MIKNLLGDDDESPPVSEETKRQKRSEPTVMGLFDSESDSVKPEEEPYILSNAPARPTAENVRQWGLAWSIGIVFVGSVAFLLVLGWGADLLFGSSPWGIVIGIILGSCIGFFQIFRISSQIFRN